MVDAFIVDAVRTPVGRRGGGRATVHPADLGAHARSRCRRRRGLRLRRRHRPRAGDVARTCWLAAGLPEEVPGVTGRVFEVEAGRITVVAGHQRVATVDRGSRWPVEEVGAAVAGITAGTPPGVPVYGA